MGAVLRFPTERVRGALIQSWMPEPAEILILPSVRVERGEFGYSTVPEMPVPPSGNVVSGSKRRRRAPRG
ncbi:MAG TPA: hypothetical protein VIG34_04190 [Xanthobacteraceae bacterium]|jgi:hypothetical protein